MERKCDNKVNIYHCSVCDWPYEESKGGIPFEELPDDWRCPRCGAPKEAFDEWPFYLIKYEKNKKIYS